MLTPDLALARRFVDAHPVPGRLVLCGVTGAHLYGFPSANSDIDLKGLHLAPTDSLLGLKPDVAAFDITEDFEGVECDLTTNELGAALGLLLVGNGNMLERILSPWQLVESDEVGELRDLARGAMSRRFARHYRGFFGGVTAEHQRAPTAKSMLYAYRVALTGIHFLRTGRLEADLTVLAAERGWTEVEELVVLKREGTEHGPLPEAIDEWHRARWPALDAELAEADESSPLPAEATNHAEVEAWLVARRRADLRWRDATTPSAPGSRARPTPGSRRAAADGSGCESSSDRTTASPVIAVPEVKLDLPPAVLDALRHRSERTGESIDRVAARALADALQVGHSTVFQVSTASTLVAGVADGAVTVEDLLRHGDFGLGAFAGWDGEMVVVDGTAYQVTRDGVHVAGREREVPFALVTHFVPEQAATFDGVDSAEDLQRRLDELRHTDNDLFAVRVEGHFGRLTTRAVCASTSTTPLEVAVQTQAEFDLVDVDAVLVGYWTPPHLQSVGISGWHLHGLTADRTQGGHVFDCAATTVDVGLQHLADFRLAIPETAAFRHAHLATDVRRSIDAAETKPST